MPVEHGPKDLGNRQSHLPSNGGVLLYHIDNFRRPGYAQVVQIHEIVAESSHRRLGVFVVYVLADHRIDKCVRRLIIAQFLDLWMLLFHRPVQALQFLRVILAVLHIIPSAEPPPLPGCSRRASESSSLRLCFISPTAWSISRIISSVFLNCSSLKK